MTPERTRSMPSACPSPEAPTRGVLLQYVFLATIQSNILLSQS